MAKQRKRVAKRDFSRREDVRRPARTFLIVCGGKSEFLYFTALRQCLGLGAAASVLDEPRHPRGVVGRAGREETEQSSRGAAYDEVWAVFDKDSFLDYEDLVANGARRETQPSRRGPGGKFQTRIGLAYSNPSFELWLVLHFACWHRSCSAADLDAALRQEPKLATYRHGDDVYALIDARRATAVANARDLDQRNARDGKPAGANPSTAVHLLVESLQRAAPV